MKIREVEDFVKSREPEQIAASDRVEKKLIERGLDVETVRNIVINNDICGIVDQGGLVYVIWFKYVKGKDLNVILRIKDDTCYIVTAFPCDIERRIKHGKTKREKG